MPNGKGSTGELSGKVIRSSRQLDRLSACRAMVCAWPKVPPAGLRERSHSIHSWTIGSGGGGVPSSLPFDSGRADSAALMVGAVSPLECSPCCSFVADRSAARRADRCKKDRLHNRVGRLSIVSQRSSGRPSLIVATVLATAAGSPFNPGAPCLPCHFRRGVLVRPVSHDRRVS